MDRALVVIPYLAKEAQGRELQYSIAGWRRHFKHPHHIVVVGDYHPVVDTGDDITFIDCPQVSYVGNDNYRPHIDHVHKFREVRELFSEDEGFIYTCDDIYAVNDFTLEDVLLPKINGWDMGGDSSSPNGWKRDVAKTRKACIDNGLNVWDWVCHLPVYYNWNKLFHIYDAFDCDRCSYVVENIYFNLYHNGETPTLVDGIHGRLKFTASSPNPVKTDLESEFKSKIWINNNPNGYRPVLDRMLFDYYSQTQKLF